MLSINLQVANINARRIIAPFKLRLRVLKPSAIVKTSAKNQRKEERNEKVAMSKMFRPYKNGNKASGANQ